MARRLLYRLATKAKESPRPELRISSHTHGSHAKKASELGRFKANNLIQGVSMNKTSAQKFMNLFDEMLMNRNAMNAKTFDKTECKDEIDLLNAHQEESLSTRLDQRNLLFLKKVEAAKAKILDGTYGTCEDCGDDISQKRLLARPTASLCIGCQEAKESLEKHNIKHRRDLTVGKGKETEVDGEELVARKTFSNVKDIKFESVVDL